MQQLLARKYDDFTPWREKTLSTIRLLFGEPSTELEWFARLYFQPTAYYPGMPESDYQKAYLRGLNQAKAELESTKFECESAHSAQQPPLRTEIEARGAAPNHHFIL